MINFPRKNKWALQVIKFFKSSNYHRDYREEKKTSSLVTRQEGGDDDKDLFSE